MNNLTIIKDFSTEKNGIKRRMLLCRCVCGNTTEIRRHNYGKTLSCGCLAKEKARKMKTKHGGAYSYEYRSWRHMKERCLNKNNHAYKNYGGRGISISDRWVNDFSVFLQDMGERPSLSHTLERTDNNKGYYPDNCYWATKKEQGRNRSTTILDEDSVSLIKAHLKYKWLPQVKIAKLFNVTSSLISSINAGKVWRDVPCFPI